MYTFLSIPSTFHFPFIKALLSSSKSIHHGMLCVSYMCLKRKTLDFQIFRYFI